MRDINNWRGNSCIQIEGNSEVNEFDSYRFHRFSVTQKWRAK